MYEGAKLYSYKRRRKLAWYVAIVVILMCLQPAPSPLKVAVISKHNFVAGLVEGW